MAIPFLNNIDLVKNQLLNAVFQNLAVAPSNPVEGQFYYNTTDKKMFYYNGTAWVDTTYLLPIASATVLGGVKVGSGLAIDGNGVLSATGTDTEIINNLTSDRTDAALAAAQGKALKGLIDTIQSTIDGLGTAATKNVGTASGNIPVLDSNGKLNTSVLPALAITEVFTVASQSAMTSLTAQQGDVAVRTDVNKTFILSKEPAATAANWIELQFPISVTSVNGKTGIITLTGEDINATVGSVTKSVQSFLADLGEIDLKVQENTTTITTIETQVNNITNTKGEAEGKNIHIEDSAEEPFVDISLHGESTQNGTPTSDNLVEIENIEGKNKFDYESAINVENLTYDNTYAFFEIKNIKPNTAYTISNLKLTDLTNLGYSVYAGLTIGNTYSTGPGKAFYSCIYNNVYKNGIGVVTGYSGTKANGGKLYFCIATTNTNKDLAYERFIKICSMVFDKAQIEEGTVATPYVPYNSLEFKVEGKNKFNVQDTNNVTEGITVDNEGWITVTGDNTDGTATKYFNYYTNNLNLKTGTNFNVIAEVKNVSGTGNASFVSVNSSSQQFKTNFYRNFSVLANNTIYNSINETSDEFLGNTGLRTFISFSAGQSGSITFRISVLEDTTITSEKFDYEPYKSQVATFPLGEEKLMEGSYLADDGIHHKRKQVVFDGSDDESWTANGSNQGYGIVIDNVGGNTVGNVTSSVLCDKLTAVPQNTIYNGSAINGVASYGGTVSKLYVRFDSSITSGSLLREKLAESPILIEYELSEPETVPYTAEQQEAWEKIKAMYTYKNITNITSDAYAKVTYMRDNGLDVYETKQNAEKNYTETTKKLAEQKITTDEISSKVSSLETTLENNYSTTEEMNSAITAKVNEIITELLPIKIITGVIPGSSYDENSKTQTVVIDYPSGFNASNTIVIASMLKPVSTDCTSTYSGRVDVLLYSSGEYANKMEVLFSEAWGLDMYYKIVLMKM